MIRVANAPCSWGVIENIEGSRLTYKTVLDEIAECGYSGTELGEWGFMPTDPDRLSAELQSRGLALVGGWVSLSPQERGDHWRCIKSALATAELLRAAGGPDALVILGNDPHADPVRTKHAGRITPELGLTDEQWEAFLDGTNAVALAVQDETGLRTVFHPHVATFVETAEEIDRFVEGTDPDLVGLAFDTAHFAYGGSDAVQALKRYAERVWHVHLKGYSSAVAQACRTDETDAVEAVGRGLFCGLAESDLDFPAILSALKDHGYDGWAVVEQDVLPGTGTPRENALRNRAFLHSLGV